MNMPIMVEVYGDSILRGVQVNPQMARYHIDNNIGFEEIEKKHFLSIKNFSKFGCTITKGLASIEKRLKSNEPPCDVIVMNFF